MQLSGRMERLASLVTEGNRLADVGTDHGYLPIALVRERRIPSAIAMDVNQGPLDRAKEHIRTYGLDTYIETRLSDGLTKLKAGEADTVLIAGMGGQLMARILKGGAHCLDSVKELILQPQSEIWLVRKWLEENGFAITDEDIVKDEGKYYPMMRAVHGESAPLGEAELSYGNVTCQRSLETLAGYLRAELEKNERILERLLHTGQEGSERMEELGRKKEWICQTLDRLTGEKAAGRKNAGIKEQNDEMQ